MWWMNATLLMYTSYWIRYYQAVIITGAYYTEESVRLAQCVITSGGARGHSRSSNRHREWWVDATRLGDCVWRPLVRASAPPPRSRALASNRTTRTTRSGCCCSGCCCLRLSASARAPFPAPYRSAPRSLPTPGGPRPSTHGARAAVTSDAAPVVAAAAAAAVVQNYAERPVAAAAANREVAAACFSPCDSTRVRLRDGYDAPQPTGPPRVRAVVAWWVARAVKPASSFIKHMEYLKWEWQR